MSGDVFVCPALRHITILGEVIFAGVTLDSVTLGRTHLGEHVIWPSHLGSQHTVRAFR